MLAIDALQPDSQRSWLDDMKRYVTHKPPSMKIPETWTFLDVGICSRHTSGIGRNSITKSKITFWVPWKMIAALKLMQCAEIVGSQLAWIGTQ